MSAAGPARIAATESAGAAAAIFYAGLLCGVFDITSAFITWALQGVPPARVLQGIAAGFLGPESFKGGAATVTLGAFLHFLIAFSAAAVFYVASRKIDFMTRSPILAGVLYVGCVYLVMYWIVMPLSRLHRSQTLGSTIVAIITHMVCVGLPISLMVRRFAGPR